MLYCLTQTGALKIIIERRNFIKLRHWRSNRRAQSREIKGKKVVSQAKGPVFKSQLTLFISQEGYSNPK